MGEITEMILDGILCQCCGAAMEDVEEGFIPPGYPRTCLDCAPNSEGGWSNGIKEE